MHKSNSDRKPRVGIRDLRANLSGYIRRAQDGQIVEVMSRAEVVAELHPATRSPKVARRKIGALQGKIRIAPNFDELPKELLDAFEN